MSFQKVMSNSFFTNLFGTIERNRTVKDYVINYLLTPINNGLIGFALVFTAIISVRFFDRLFLFEDIQYITIDDLLTASIGLMIFGLGRMIINLIYSIKIKLKSQKNIS